DQTGPSSRTGAVPGRTLLRGVPALAATGLLDPDTRVAAVAAAPPPPGERGTAPDRARFPELAASGPHTGGRTQRWRQATRPARCGDRTRRGGRRGQVELHAGASRLARSHVRVRRISPGSTATLVPDVRGGRRPMGSDPAAATGRPCAPGLVLAPRHPDGPHARRARTAASCVYRARPLPTRAQG